MKNTLATRSLCFNTQPPEGGWAILANMILDAIMFQHTAARRRLALQIGFYAALFKGFNTQPPEGGWNRPGIWRAETTLFQHTAARRRLDEYGQKSNQKCYVSTHSRPKAAGNMGYQVGRICHVSTHSRPKAAGCSFALSYIRQ